MVGAGRAAIVASLVVTIALAIAPSDAPTHDQPRVSAADAGGGVWTIDWTIDAPDFVAPAPLVVPTRPGASVAAAAAAAPAVEARARDVLGVAPKTSPPPRG